MARSKAFLFKGIKIFWKCAPEVLTAGDDIPTETEFNFPNGLLDFLNYQIGTRLTINRTPFSGEAELAGDEGKVEWAITWPDDEKAFAIPTATRSLHRKAERMNKGFVQRCSKA